MRKEFAKRLIVLFCTSVTAKTRRLLPVQQKSVKSIMLSGNNLYPTKRLTFERTTETSILSDFFCGISSMDKFIHEELQDYVNMGNCEMYIVREENDVVAMFCLDNNCLYLADSTREKMQKGIKPCPQGTSDPDNPFWYRPSFDAVEISYLAVSESKQRQHIGWFIIDQIMDRVATSDMYNCEFVTVRALKEKNYTAVPFYKKCGFYPARKEQEGENLFMYRVVMRD